MATKKDLVEAYSFSRRRLITAFLSGAPGGREVEPSRPGRTVVGGLALAVLLVAGAAIASVLASRTPEDWNQVGLVVTRGDQPATYVILEEDDPPELIPVINITSAQLILGADVKATSVDQEVVDEETPGIPIGILGAPQTLPRPDQFIESGWTACTDDGVGIAVDVSEDQKVERTETQAIVVQSVGAYWLIATSNSGEGKQQRAYRYPISEDESDQLLVDFHLGPKRSGDQRAPGVARAVPGGRCDRAGGVRRTALRPAGPELTRSRVPGWVTTSSSAGEGRWWSTVASRRWTRSRWRCCENNTLSDGPTQLEGGRTAATTTESGYLASHWPDTELRPLNSAPCAQLDVAAGQVPRVWLAGSPTGDAESPAQGSDGAIPGDQRNVTLDRGHAAFVQVGTWDETESDSTVVVDPLGKAYPLVGGPITLEKLGYDLERRRRSFPTSGPGCSTRASSCRRARRCARRPTSRGSRSRRRTAGRCRREVALACAAVVAASLMVCPAAASADDGVEADCQAIPVQDATHYATSQPSLPLQEMGVDDAAGPAEEGARAAGRRGHRGGHRLGGREQRADHHRRDAGRGRQQGGTSRSTTTAPPWPD